MSKERDFQRARVYQAEHAASLIYPGGGFDSLAQVGIWLSDIQKKKWYSQFYSSRHLMIENGKGSRSHVGRRMDGFYMRLPPHTRTEWFILHGLAHCLQGSLTSAHGPEFCSVYLWLVKKEMGRKAEDALGSSFAKFKVKLGE